MRGALRSVLTRRCSSITAFGFSPLGEADQSAESQCTIKQNILAIFCKSIDSLESVHRRQRLGESTEAITLLSAAVFIPLI